MVPRLGERKKPGALLTVIFLRQHLSAFGDALPISTPTIDRRERALKETRATSGLIVMLLKCGSDEIDKGDRSPHC